MKFSVLTLFPEMFTATVNESITGRAIEKGIIQTEYINIRDFSLNRHRHTDDYPYGAGGGMVMECESIYRAYKSVCKGKKAPHTIYLSPQGTLFNQDAARRLSKEKHLVLLCGHYEGVDERVIEEIADEEISIGDYVLTGGELGAMVIIDAVSRMIDGVLDSSETREAESLYNSLLEYPQYTRPSEYFAKAVPEVLLSGHHARIAAWRRTQSLIRTKAKRPELLAGAELTAAEREMLMRVAPSCRTMTYGDIQLCEKGGKIVEITRPKYIDTGETPLLRRAGEFIAQCMESGCKRADFPYEAEGSDFERRVWDAILKLKRGERTTYGALAKRLRASVQSVYAACAKNPLPFIIPCHRVCAQKTIGTYPLGIEIKAKLCDSERDV